MLLTKELKDSPAFGYIDDKGNELLGYRNINTGFFIAGFDATAHIGSNPDEPMNKFKRDPSTGRIKLDWERVYDTEVGRKLYDDFLIDMGADPALLREAQDVSDGVQPVTVKALTKDDALTSVKFDKIKYAYERLVEEGTLTPNVKELTDRCGFPVSGEDKAKVIEALKKDD